MNVFNIERTFRFKEEKKWDMIYVAIDAHGTIIRPYHHCIDFYPDSVEVLQWMTRRKDIRIILWTSSHSKEVVELVREGKRRNITFDYCNRNPLEFNTDRACFDLKFYFNILLEDKAGFEPESDWLLVKNELLRIGEWDKEIS